MSKTVFKKELKELIFSRAFLLYIFLLFLPLFISIWFSHQMYTDASVIEAINQILPNEITEITPKIALMVFLDLSMLSIALIPIVHMTKTIAGEKEKGNLSYLLTKPIKRTNILLSKWSSFLFVFVSLLSLTTVLMAIATKYIGIGLVRKEIFLAYLLAALIYGLVYTNVSTLFSSITKKTTHSSLSSLVVLVGWMTLDFVITYLPNDMKEYLEEFSLSHHIHKIIGYLTDGEATLFATGAQQIYPSNQSLYYTILAIILVGAIIPLVISITSFNKQDI